MTWWIDTPVLYEAPVIYSPGTTVAAGVTTYIRLAGAGFNTTETLGQSVMQRPGNVRNLVIVTTTAQPGTGAMVATLRKNGVDTGLTVTIPANAPAGTYTDLVDVVPYTTGDLLSIKFVNAAGAASASVQTCTIGVGS